MEVHSCQWRIGSSRDYAHKYHHTGCCVCQIPHGEQPGIILRWQLRHHENCDHNSSPDYQHLEHNLAGIQQLLDAMHEFANTERSRRSSLKAEMAQHWHTKHSQSVSCFQVKDIALANPWLNVISTAYALELDRF